MMIPLPRRPMALAVQHTDASRRPQQGTGMAGFLAALIPILMLGLGGVELAHWMSLRQTLSLALMDAARAGTTRQARPQAIADAFEQGLQRLYPRPEALSHALQTRQQALGAPWRIQIRLPSAAAFLDHADRDVIGPRHSPGQALIRNDYQAAQQTRRLAQGWPQGRGPQSGLSIHEANTLLMDLWWPQRPMLPGTAGLIRALAPLHGDPEGRALMHQGYLPFRRRIRMSMQSHPAQWPDLPDGRVVHRALASSPKWPVTGVNDRADPDPALPGASPGTPPDRLSPTPGSQAGPGTPSAGGLPDTGATPENALCLP